jgi:hypothetical protein
MNPPDRPALLFYRKGSQQPTTAPLLPAHRAQTAAELNDGENIHPVFDGRLGILVWLSLLMTIAIDQSIQQKPLSFDDFLVHHGENNRYELIDGEVFDLEPTGSHKARMITSCILPNIFLHRSN